MNLIVKEYDKTIFSSDGHWLYPLFELEDFLKKNNFDLNKISLKDKLIGRGAAVLISTMGVKICHGRIMSRKALPVLEEYHIQYSYDELVDSLLCQTETVLTDSMKLNDAYDELARRAGRNE